MLANTPIQEGFEITNQTRSYSVVTLENGSTAVISEDSRLRFYQLTVEADGRRLTGITVKHGRATFHFRPKRHDRFEVKIGDATITASARCRFRTDVGERLWGLKVFRGTVAVTVANKTSNLRKGECAVHAIGRPLSDLNVKKGIDKDPWDHWVEKQETLVMLSDIAADNRRRRGPPPVYAEGSPGGELSAPQ